MYCPKCGDVLTPGAGGGLACERGGMRMSQRLERGLKECFVDRTRTPRGTPMRFAVGGSWWCPGCGVAMVETTPGLVICSRCGLALTEFIVDLVELHPHRRPATGSKEPS